MSASLPSTRAALCRPPAKRTIASRAPATTWWLVTISPSGDSTTPEPAAAPATRERADRRPDRLGDAGDGLGIGVEQGGIVGHGALLPVDRTADRRSGRTPHLPMRPASAPGAVRRDPAASSILKEDPMSATEAGALAALSRATAAAVAAAAARVVGLTTAAAA